MADGRTYGIRMTADGSGLVGASKQSASGLDELRKSAVALGADLKKLEGDVAKVTSSQDAYNTILQKTLEAEIKYRQGLGQQAAAVKSNAAETADFVKRLKETADTLGKNRADVEAYRAAQLTLTDAQKASAASSVAAIRAHDEHAAAMGRLKTVALAAAAATIAYATSSAFTIKAIIDEADQHYKLSQSLGVSTQGMSAYRYQASLAGVSNQEFSIAMRALVKNISEAQSGVGDGARLFRLLGSEVESAAKRGAPLEEMLPRIADAFSRFADGPNKAALALALLGTRTGEVMIPMMNQGAAGFSAAAREAEQFNRIVGPGFARESEQFNTNLQRMNALLDVQKQMIAREVVPSLNQYLNVLIEIAKQEGGSLIKGFIGAGAAGGGTREQQIARLEAQRAKLLAPDADPDMRRVDLPYIERALAVVRAQPTAWEAAFAEQQRRYAQIQAPPIPKAASAGATDNDRLIEQITRMDALTTARVDSTRQLTEAERLLYTTQALYEAGLTTLTPKQFEQRQEELASIAVGQRAVEQRAREVLAAKDAARAYNESAKALFADTARQDDNLRKLVEHNEEIGLTHEQLGQLKIARAEDALATAQQAAALDSLRDSEDAYSVVVQERVRQAEEFLRVTREGVVKSNSAEQAKQARADWKSTNDYIQRSLTDALMRGWDAGKTFAQNFRDTVVNMFKTLVLEPSIRFLMAPAANALTGLTMGLFGGNASAGGLGMANNALSLGNLFSGGNSLTGQLGYGIQSALGLGGAASWGLAEEAAALGIGGMGEASAGFLGMGPAGWAVGAGLLAMSLLGDDSGPTTRTSRFNQPFGQAAANNYPWQNNRWFSSEMWPAQEQFQNQQTAQEQALIARLGLSPAQIASVNTALAGANAQSYNFGTEHTPIEQSGGFQAVQAARLQAISTALGRSIEDLTSIMSTSSDQWQSAIEQLEKSVAQQQNSLSQFVRGLPGQLGITNLEDFQRQLALGEAASPTDRLAAARGYYADTLAQARGGNLDAVMAFSSRAQDLYSIARDTYASGAGFQSIAETVKADTAGLLEKERALQLDILGDVPAAIREAKQDQVAEIRRQTAELVAAFNAATAELQRINVNLKG